MLKIINKALFLSALTCSFIVPMGQLSRIATARTLNQSVHFCSTLAARCPLFWAGSMDQIAEKVLEAEVQKNDSQGTMVNESFVIKNQDASLDNTNNHHLKTDNQNISYVKMGDTIYGISIDPNTSERTLICCLNSNSDNQITALPLESMPDRIAQRMTEQCKQGDQHLAQNSYNDSQERIFQQEFTEVHKKLSSEIDHWSEQVALNQVLPNEKASECMKDYNSCSNDELKSEKGKHVQELFQLQKKLESLIDQNSYVCVYFQQMLKTSDASILHDFTKKLSIADKCDLKKALELEIAIQKKSATIHEIDCKIKQETEVFTNQLKQQSLKDLQTVTILSFVAQKESIEKDIASKQLIFEKNQQTLNNLKNQQNKLNSSSFLSKGWRSFTRDDIEIIVAKNIQSLQAKQDQNNAAVKSLKLNLAKCNEQIDQVQKVIDEKQQFELQEIQFAQEQQETYFLQEQVQSQYDQLNFETENCPDVILEEQYHDRQEALFKTKEQGYQSYNQQHSLSAQAQAYAQLIGIDSSQMKNFQGTALQQQLHAEGCSILEQAAKSQIALPSQSAWLTQAVLCTDAAYQANRLNQIQNVVALNNLGFTLLEYDKAILTGAFLGVQGAVHSIVHLDQTVKSIAKAVYYVLESAALNCYNEEDGFEDLYIPLRDQRNAEIIAGLKNLGHAIQNSTGPQKVQALTQFAVEFGVSGKIINVVGGVANLASTTAVKGVKTIQAEMQTSNIKQTVASIVNKIKGSQEIVTDVAKTTQNMQAVAQESNISRAIAKELINAEKKFATKTGKPTPPRTADTKKISALKKAERLAHTDKGGKTRKLPDGRIRYYEAENFSNTPGPTRGRSKVTEYDPKTERLRIWMECYDHFGKVNRVRPTMINGKEIVSQHYPITYKDTLEKIKGSKWYIPDKSLD